MVTRSPIARVAIRYTYINMVEFIGMATRIYTDIYVGLDSQAWQAITLRPLSRPSLPGPGARHAVSLP
jgi:hypothetical protein